ncbi:hypothetical protein DHEL01_v210265 [Diaporthe helianthi]|uniref:Uncharacterized protein n=1 Tax=Diaporthe helianthi TaxID=158607 RepID=A0A2P5HM65_DIAHE|nr:hypothetical protein DHEL01_v210265 [Diaporthe helianthi]
MFCRLCKPDCAGSPWGALAPHSNARTAHVIRQLTLTASHTCLGQTAAYGAAGLASVGLESRDAASSRAPAELGRWRAKICPRGSRPMPPGLGRFGCVPNHILLDMPLQLCRRESRRLSRKRASWLAGWLAACMPASIVRCPVRLTPVLEAKHSTETQNPAEAPYDGYYTLQSPSRSLSLARRDSRATMSRTPVQNRGNSRARNRGRPNFN